MPAILLVAIIGGRIYAGAILSGRKQSLSSLVASVLRPHQAADAGLLVRAVDGLHLGRAEDRVDDRQHEKEGDTAENSELHEREERTTEVERAWVGNVR